jgi:hypothetical protein
MNPVGWKRLVAGYPWYTGDGSFKLSAYSEFMPPPHIGCSPLGEIDAFLFSDNDLYGWKISEIEEEYELKPGIEHIGNQLLKRIINLGKGHTEHHIAGHGNQNLTDNPYWPSELSEQAGKLDHERYVVFLSSMLSRTQDDKGRVNWTFFGSSIHGPEYAFWNSFYSAPGIENKSEDSVSFIRKIITNAYGEKLADNYSLEKVGFGILKSDENSILPEWTKPFLLSDGSSFDKVKYILTFRPFGNLPAEVKELYFKGKLCLLPFPGSLVFWGMPTYLKLKEQLPLAEQIPLLKLVVRNRGLGGLRVMQAGWLHEHHPDNNNIVIQKELLHEHYHRTHRWERIHRHQDELSLEPRVERLVKVLFSTDLESIGLYDKPLARNSHIWTKDFELLLNGPVSTKNDLLKAETRILKGGLFGFRFYYPPMHVGPHEVFWHRPIVGYLSFSSNEIEILPESLTGIITAYHKDDTEYNNPVELWPRLLQRKNYMAAIKDFHTRHDHYAHQTTLNLHSLFDSWEMMGEKPIPRSLAHRLLNLSKHKTLQQWIDELTIHSHDMEVGKKMQSVVEKMLEPEHPVTFPTPITYEVTQKRAFEESWWNDINFLAHGQFINKDNADCVQDDATLDHLRHHHRDLEKLGDYLIKRHKDNITQFEMEGKAFCGELPFKWTTDFDFSAFGGWKRNQEGHTYERNILVIIPGKNRKEAVVLGDHYDTAYMEDIFEKGRGGTGARLSANGADDNYSATATLLQAAPIYLQLAKEGKLERDIWLLHLTGEEFPSDCMGARNFCQKVVEKTIKLHLDNDSTIDLSETKVVGVYVMDMIGHNKDSDQNIFQISPGKSVKSMKLALHAHLANEMWNENAHHWNRSNSRMHLQNGKRSADGTTIPEMAHHLALEGEVRNHYNPHSSIFNTDGQIFSDVGIPVVLFMENYDIHRTGYHDTKDTMENIDLDYGSAFAAIAIETVARVASLNEEDN